MKVAIYPGTFDPLTCGHLDLIERTAGLFDRVVVAVAASARKQPLFSLQQRVALVESSVSHLDQVMVASLEGLLVHFAEQHAARYIVRAARSTTDFEYELQLAQMNRAMLPAIETLFFTPSERFAYVSSTLVREIAAMGGDFDQFVPPVVAAALRERFRA
ncbi:MAG: pantetheine-phosphate adenylyltransferase [Spongiibacteraceae bacterium]|nr:pantetheine-phosphate adenylyltransferase [Spongiibacteraceae bacterium]